MDTFEAIYERRAVKHYDPQHRLTDAEISKLMNAAMQSPTSFNIQNWRFVLVQKQELRDKLRAAAWDQAQVSESSLLIIVTADLKSWSKSTERYWKNSPPEIGKQMMDMTGPFYEGKEQLQRDEAMRSCGIAAQTIMLSAKAMGFDSCPMIGFDPQQVAQLISLPEDHVIGLMIAVGKAIKPAWPKPGQLSYEEVVISDSFDS